jgi:hypothetical protein
MNGLALRELESHRIEVFHNLLSAGNTINSLTPYIDLILIARADLRAIAPPTVRIA